MNILKYLQTVAHELGHNLNMDHDFGSSVDDFTDLTIDRYHPDGTKCTDDSGIMDYFGVRKL